MQEVMTMSFINTISPEDAPNDVRSMYQRQQDFWGYVPNYAKSFSPRPALMERWGRLIAEVRRPMEPRLYELATFVAANELRNTPCSIAHGSRLKPFYSIEQLCALAGKEPVPGMSDLDAAIVEFARVVARDAATVRASDVKELRDLGLEDEVIFDIAAAVAARAFFTKVLDAVGSAPDAPLGGIDAELKQAFTVGKPISDESPEVMT
jgi:alkylhydroperoxidase family enzyme